MKRFKQNNEMPKRLWPIVRKISTKKGFFNLFDLQNDCEPNAVTQ